MLSLQLSRVVLYVLGRPHACGQKGNNLLDLPFCYAVIGRPATVPTFTLITVYTI